MSFLKKIKMQSVKDKKEVLKKLLISLRKLPGEIELFPRLFPYSA